MKAIDRKLWRELWKLRMQVIAIAMVIVGGVSIFIMSLSTLDSLFTTRAEYYRDHHFAEVFATLKRAPQSLRQRIEAIPGVDKVQTRVVAYVSIDVPGFDDPVSGHLVSLPPDSRGLLNQIYLRKGRLLESGRDNEVMVSVRFAEAHGLEPGDRLDATINGRRKKMTVSRASCRRNTFTRLPRARCFPITRATGYCGWRANRWPAPTTWTVHSTTSR